MTLKNKFYNWRHKVKRLRRKGCKNVGVVDELYSIPFITKYDWSKPLVYHSKLYELTDIPLAVVEHETKFWHS